MNPPSPTILIVDDQPSNLRLLYDALEQAGYLVRAVSSGEAALRSIALAMPDMILLDVMMPGLGGFATCRQIKADPAMRDIPVLFMTARSDPVDEVAGLELGAVDYITKPIQIATVLARIRTHLTLRRLMVSLQQHNAELDAYARTVAHDLKSPLSAIQGAAQLLQTSSAHALTASPAPYLTIISSATRRATATIDALLLLAQVRQMHVVPEPLEMAPIVHNAIARLAGVVEQRHAIIKVPDRWPSACGYAPWVELAWSNYISNAVKYGGDPPRVELGATRCQNDSICFWVQDNGPGIGKVDQARLFSEFTRLEPERAEGHGLGLAIVRRITTRLGGEVGIESTHGQGSRFYFTLPAAAAAPP